MRNAKFGIVLLATALSGCITFGPDQIRFVRTDRQPIDDSHPAQQQQLRTDRNYCVAQARKAASGMPLIYSKRLEGAITTEMVEDPKMAPLIDVIRTCMLERGYRIDSMARVKGRSSG